MQLPRTGPARHSNLYRPVKHLALRFGFAFRRSAFIARQTASNARVSIAIALSVFRLALWPTLTALLVFAATTKIPEALPASWSHNSVAAWLTSQPSFALTTSLLTTITATAGLLLALFFTAMSVVASTSYIDVTNRVRRLVLQDKVGSTYLAVLAHLAALALFTLLFMGFGVAPNRLLFGYIALLAPTVILTFYKLGLHVFASFDPLTLCRKPRRDFRKWLKAATISGNSWADPSFQRCYRDNATDALESIQDLLHYACTGKQVVSHSVVGISHALLDLLVNHAQQKHRIPTRSEWFARTYTFRRWEYLSAFDATVAIETGTAPAAQDAPDPIFVSRRVTASIQKSLQTLLDRQCFQELPVLMARIHATAHSLGAALALPDALYLLHEILPFVSQKLVNLQARTDEDRLAILSSINLFASSYVSLMLGLTAFVRSLAPGALLDTAQDVRTLKREALYRNLHPPPVLEALESLQDGLRFERFAEGSVLSPTWYLQERVALAYAHYLEETLRSFCSIIDHAFLGRSGSTQQSANALYALEWLRVGIEFATKLQAHLATYHSRINDFRTFLKNEYEQAPLDFDSFQTNVSNRRLTLLRDAAGHLDTAFDFKAQDPLPDYAGLLRATLNEELVTLLVTRKKGDFDSLFPHAFNAALRTSGSYLASADGLLARAHVGLAYDTLLEVLELSGLALLFQELYNIPLFAIPRGCWDNYLDSLQEPARIIAFCYAAIGDLHLIPLLSPGSAARQRWAQIFVGQMEAEGLDVYGCEVPWAPRSGRPRASMSPLLRCLQMHLSSLFTSPSACFAAVYLSRRPGATDLPLPSEIESIRDSLERSNWPLPGDKHGQS